MEKQIADFIEKKIAEKKLTTYYFQSNGIGNNVMDSILRKNEKTYTMKSLIKVLNLIGVESLNLNINECKLCVKV